MEARYFPLMNGLYEVSAGLKPLGFDFGNADLDTKVFQFDHHFPKFRQNKEHCRQERLSKYYVTRNLDPLTEAAVVRFMMQRLLSEWPLRFELQSSGPHLRFSDLTTGDTLFLDQQHTLVRYEGPLKPTPTSALEAIGCLVPEDFAILSRKGDKDWLSALHLCAPSHWAAEDKIGMDFTAVHQPIPGIEKVLRASRNLVDAMIHKGPFVRFVWSFVTDDRLNHHPEAPAGWDPAEWKGRAFDRSKENPFNLRIERQVVYGLPESNASLFLIRISFWTGLEIKADSVKRQALVSALHSMTPAARAYKGVAHCFDDLVKWLTTSL